MHIPDGYLGPETVAAGWISCAPAWWYASRRAREALSRPKAVPVMAAGAAFSFLIMMINVPVLGGTTAHAVGAVLVAILAGPEVAVLAVTAALAIQAVLFADGGIVAFGVNCLNMAVVMPYVGYGVYRLVGGGAEPRSKRGLAGAAAGAYVGVLAAAALVGVELGIQPALHTVHGVAQYAPYGLRTSLAAMLGTHALVIGPIEAAFTVAVVGFLARSSPELFRRAGGADASAPQTRRLVGVLVALLVIAPLGLLAGGTAWGEWSASELGRRIGYVPSGLARAQGASWRGLIPRYALPGHGTGVWAVVGYVLSALVGVAVLAIVAWCVARLRRRGGPAGDMTAPPPHKDSGRSPA